MIYTESDVQRGIGAFDQAMRYQSAVPGSPVRYTPGMAIGVISAAMRSGLKVKHLRPVIEREFSFDQYRLLRTLDMYKGSDWDMNLWDEMDNGTYKLCTALCRLEPSGWRYNPNAKADD